MNTRNSKPEHAFTADHEGPEVEDEFDVKRERNAGIPVKSRNAETGTGVDGQVSHTLVESAEEPSTKDEAEG